MIALASWANGRIYIEECFASGQRYWSSEQDDAVRSTLERRGIIDNTRVCNAVIVDGQTGPRVAPEGFIMKNWSAFVERREAISFELLLDIRDPLDEEAEEEEAPPLEPNPGYQPEPEPCLEYIAASSLADLFGY
jgi:hypothetical protein